MFRDVTELRRAEAASARLAEIVTSSDDGIISKDLQGRITSWNHGTEKIFGFTAQEAVGQDIALIAPEDRKPEARSILERIHAANGSTTSKRFAVARTAARSMSR